MQVHDQHLNLIMLFLGTVVFVLVIGSTEYEPTAPNSVQTILVQPQKKEETYSVVQPIRRGES